MLQNKIPVGTISQTFIFSQNKKREREKIGRGIF